MRRRLTLVRILSAVLLALPLGIYAVQQGGEETVVSQPGDALQEIGTRQQLFAQAMQRLEQRLQTYPADYEASLLIALLRFKSGDLDGALSAMRELTRREPKFHLAHLIEGDMLLAQARVISDIGSAPVLGDTASNRDEISHLRDEAEARLSAYLDTLPQGRLPRALLWLDERIETALVVDKSGHRLYVYRRDANGEPQLLHDYYVSTGKLDGNKSSSGDLRTPEGVYFITSHIPDEKLPDLYGIGAYPMNYPNEWDRHQGKTGYGIWLHGTENAFYSRPPLDSEGCVVLPNLDLQNVEQYLRPGVTPIVVTDRVQWLEQDAWVALRNEVAQAIDQWRDDWQAAGVEQYLQHYAGDFWSGAQNLAAWKDHKRRVAAGKQWQKVDISQLSFFAYPQMASHEREMVVANFRQRYDSNNYNSEMDKTLYLVKEEGGWKVLYEGGR